MHSDGLLDDEAVFGELANGLAGIGGRDFGHFIGVKPYLALAAVENVGREALLRA